VVDILKKIKKYWELIWFLAKMDVKLRFQGSILGYLWSVLSPLLLFGVLYFVFSNFFKLNQQHYSIQLIVAIMMFGFFSEGTSAGMMSIFARSNLITKINIPRWTLIISSTLNSAIIYLFNVIVIVVFFVINKFLPSWQSILIFLLFSLLLYVFILAFSFFAAPLFVRFRDLSMIWVVLIQILFYATPVVYPLSLVPVSTQKILLFTPLAFMIHFTKTALVDKHYPESGQLCGFVAAALIVLCLSFLVYRRLNKRLIELL